MDILLLLTLPAMGSNENTNFVQQWPSEAINFLNGTLCVRVATTIDWICQSLTLDLWNFASLLFRRFLTVFHASTLINLLWLFIYFVRSSNAPRSLGRSQRMMDLFTSKAPGMAFDRFDNCQLFRTTKKQHRWWPFLDWRPWHHRHVSLSRYHCRDAISR